MDAWDRARVAEILRAQEDASLAPQAKRAAVAIALSLAPAPRVILMRRVRHPNDPWSGQISLPGGRSEPGDERLLATAIRETREEVGVDLAQHATLLGQLAPIQARARGRMMPMDVSPFVFALEREVAPVPSGEAEEAFWLPLDRAARGELDHVYRYVGEGGRERTMPSWRFERHVVWGMTYGILSALIQRVVGPARPSGLP